MKHSTLAACLKAVLVLLFVWVLLLYIWLLPSLVRYFLENKVAAPLSEIWYMIFTEMTVFPCIAVLVFAWHVAVRIGQNRSFSMSNAKDIMRMAYLLLGDLIYFFVGNILLFVCGKSDISVVMLSLFICAAVAAAAVVLTVLSHMVRKASCIEIKNQLTV